MKNCLSKIITVLCFLCFLFISSKSFCYLSPEEVLVVANMNARRSVSLAVYYINKRHIPKDNFLKIWCTDSERISREDYNKKIKIPIQKFLKEHPRNKIRCLLLIHGIPLKVQGIPPSLEQQTELKNLKIKLSLLQEQLKSEKDIAQKKSLQNKIKKLKNKLMQLNLNLNTSASVDSELSLVKVKDYPLAFWIPNPFFLLNQKSKLKYKKKDVLLVARLDGPDPEIVKRIIDDSIYAEKNGLKGVAYFDARWKEPKNKKKLGGYAFYDYSLHLAAKEIRKSKLLKVVLEDTKRLFKKNECKNAALYCGWYSLGHYIDSFTWVKGAIGYHMASVECETLKNKNSNIWCVKMLQKGVAATVGPVGEPYIQAFPLPHIFFWALTDGYFSLVESYYLSLPYISWKMVLVGDPLYLPFKVRNKNIKNLNNMN